MDHRTVPSLYDPELSAHIDRAAQRLEATLHTFAPNIAPPVMEWLRSLAPDGEIPEYFRHEYRFPMLLMPWWLSQSFGTDGDEPFHGDLAYSTICGYCAVRLLDDTLDGTLTRPGLAPAGVILQGEFQGALLPHFDADHPFWDLFRRQWYGAADFAADHESAADFEMRVERRLGPSLIPLAAVAWHAGREESLTLWATFAQRLSRLEQLLDDLTDWVVDAERNAPNVVLAGFSNRALPDEPLPAWMLRDGVAWGLGQADSWRADAVAAARPLQSEGVAAFLAGRAALLTRLREEILPGLAELARLRTAFSPAP